MILQMLQVYAMTVDKEDGSIAEESPGRVAMGQHRPVTSPSSANLIATPGNSGVPYDIQQSYLGSRFHSPTTKNSIPQFSIDALSIPSATHSHTP